MTRYFDFFLPCFFSYFVSLRDLFERRWRFCIRFPFSLADTRWHQGKGWHKLSIRLHQSHGTSCLSWQSNIHISEKVIAYIASVGCKRCEPVPWCRSWFNRRSVDRLVTTLNSNQSIQYSIQMFLYQSSKLVYVRRRFVCIPHIQQRLKSLQVRKLSSRRKLRPL